MSGFVDTHPKSDGGHDHLHVLVEELVLPVGAQLAVQPGVIGDGLDAVGAEHVGQLFGGLAVQRIDDPALSLFVEGYSGLMLLIVWSFLIFGWMLVVEVWPVERRNENIRVAETEVLYDIALYLRRGGGDSGRSRG